MAEKAITLVEMVISLAITAILTTIILVSFRFVDGRQLDIQARNMLSDLIWVRELAVSIHKNYTIVFNTSGETYSFYNGSIIPANRIKLQNIPVNLSTVTDWDGNSITNFSFSFPKGNATTTVLITLRQTNRLRRLNVSDETGFIRME